MPRTLKIVLLAALWWSAYALVIASQIVGMDEQAGRPVDWPAALRGSFASWLPWVPLSLGLIWIVQHYPLERGRLISALFVQTLAVVLVILLRALYVYFTDPILHWYPSPPAFAQILIASVRNNLMMSWMIIGVAHAFLFFDRAQKSRLKIIELEARVTAAKLEALSAQLNPHFLFNALNSVAELVHHDAEAADRMLVALSALLRRSLSSAPEQVLRLREELELLAQYLDIEKVRLGSRLTVHWTIDPDCLDAYVPVLILQPLVENAIVHAIARRQSPGKVHVRARKSAGQLQVDIVDDGDTGDTIVPGQGIGLQNTWARLTCLYGEDCTLRVEPLAEGGTQVQVALPYRTERLTASTAPGIV